MSLPDACALFNLNEVEDVLWSNVAELPLPAYLSDNIARILAVTSKAHQTNDAFSRTIIDQILISAIYEENQDSRQRPASSPKEDPAVLELRHETPLQRQVTYDGQPRLLSGFADYTVWYDSYNKGSLSTNLIIVEAKKLNATDTCLGQLTAYMGLVHETRREQHKKNCVVFGAASDGLTFRFLRVDNDSNWSKSRLLEWEMGDNAKIYTVFRSLVRIAALSSPTTSPVKNAQQRERVEASFTSPVRARAFDFDWSNLEILEEDDQTEIVDLQ